jgi:hypothetical protein
LSSLEAYEEEQVQTLGAVRRSLTRPTRVLAGVAAGAAVAATLGAAGSPAAAHAAHPATVTNLTAVPSAVSVLSADDAWAVSGPGGNRYDCILHWNGTTWTRMGYPGRVASDRLAGIQLLGVDALSASDVWAVGFSRDAGNEYKLYAEHWNGTNWSKVNLPSSTSPVSFQTVSIDGDSPSDIWVASARVIDHFNGTSWTRITVRGLYYAYDVAALSPSDVWIVGQGNKSGTGLVSLVTRAVHWNGTSWTQVPISTPGGMTYELAGVSSSSASNAWAVGSLIPGKGRVDTTLMEYWNGTTWTRS